MRRLNTKLLSLFTAVGLLFSVSVGCKNVETGTEIGVVPCPEKVTALRGGSFDKVAGARISYDGAVSDRALLALGHFAADLSSATGTESVLRKGRRGEIVFRTKPAMDEEEYEIKITRRKVRVYTSGDKGVLYALATLRQLLPVGNYTGTATADASWTLPCVHIQDKPRFSYRGLLLDCGRHIFSVDEIKKCLDIMAVYKLDVLHWHLTEDQGWRIQIDKYPLLTEKGAWRSGTQVGRDKIVSDGIRYGGYYTKDEIREIVAYADNLGIEIIPEIDLPGHMLAALSVFPELGCTGGPYEVWTHWGVSPDVLCPGKEETFTFLENVLGEVADLFPSKYFHIGGDECPKIRWQECPDCQAKIQELGLKDDDHLTKEQKLQTYVTARVQEFLATKGKSIIGWDEILEGDLAEGATVMSWRGTKGGIEAANRGFNAIMTPYEYLYIDYAQAKDVNKEPMAMEGCLPIEKVYSYEPYDGIPDSQQHFVLGVQTNLWTEYIGTDEYLEYMLLPRLAAASEIQWCAPENRNLDRFLEDVKAHQFGIYDAMGYNYSKVILGIYGKKE